MATAMVLGMQVGEIVAERARARMRVMDVGMVGVRKAGASAAQEQEF
jgi:hypothetical protein